MKAVHRMYGSRVPDAEEILMSEFHINKHFLGSYSSWSYGYSLTDMQRFRAPIGRLHFSGEATSMRDYGTVHGAYTAGQDTADIILKCISGLCS